MLKITTLEDIAALQENYEVECKLASGKDGKGELPKSFWETYSAFANSYGGYIVLGLKERNRVFDMVGLQNPKKLRDELWDLVNNEQKVSANLLQEKNILELNVNGKVVLCAHIPRASRKARSVFIRGNPLKGTYKRQNTGDYLCSEETVRRMLAEQVEDSRDNEILKGYGLEDIDFETFNAYRQLFASLKPDHPWNQLEPQKFLKNIGAWRIERDSEFVGLTRAGLLMFGQLPSIQEVFSNYMLDYQERPEAKTESRWIDRLTLDGAWSGNLFDFYRRVIKKLTTDLKVPFDLEGDTRRDDTEVHQALREALVNSLVHADFSGRASVLIVKRPDMFGFRNPGLMRVPVEIAKQGGESDCRNRLIHQMFRYVGLGEQAGSGLPKIYQGWDSQHWRSPSLYEKEVPSEQTLLELHMLDLLPGGAVAALRDQFGSKFDQLSQLERLILATANTEQVVYHARMAEITTDHTHDLTVAFQGLVKKGFLEASGHGRGMVYHLPGQKLPTPDQAFGYQSLVAGGAGRSEHSTSSSEHLDDSSEHMNRDKLGCLLINGLDKPLIDNIKMLDDGLLEQLSKIATDAANRGRVPKSEMENIILSLCAHNYLTLEVLAELVNRSPDALRQQYLKLMTEQGKLNLAFPTRPTHPKQAYKSNRDR